MSKISFKYKKGRIVISNKLTYPEAINEKVYTLVSNGLIKNIMPVFTKKVRKDTVIEGGAEGYVPLNDYLKEIISKKTFLKIVSIVIDTVKICEKNGLTPNNLDLDLCHIIIKPETIELMIIYWPIVNNRLAMPVSCFFKKLGETVLLPENDDNGFYDEYTAFFSALEPFSFNNFEKMITSLSGTSKPEQITKLPEKSVTSAPAKTSNNIEYDPFEGLSGKECSNDYYNIKPHEADKKVHICYNCGYESSDDYDICEKCGASFVIDKKAGTPEAAKYTVPVIIRNNTNEKFIINSHIFLIGTENSCNMIISSNAHISRRHAMINSESYGFTITDVGSLNGTYINGTRLEVNKIYSLEPGIVFQLADEFFTFKIEILT